MFREATRYIEGVGFVVERLLALVRPRPRPLPDSYLDWIRVRGQLEALFRKVPDVCGLDLLRDSLAPWPTSVEDFRESVVAAQNRAIVDAGTDNQQSEDYQICFSLRIAEQGVDRVRLLREQIVAKLEGVGASDADGGPVTTLRIDSINRVSLINGTPSFLKNDAAVAFVKAVAEKKGHLVTFPEMQKHYGELEGGNQTRIYNGLPSQVRDLIEGHRGKGWKLKENVKPL
jgi:hypothetical protein